MRNKNIEVGDKVRFLDEVGGGIVAGIEGNIILVEDEDGFEIPYQLSKVVLIEKNAVEADEEVDDKLLEVENKNVDVSEKTPAQKEIEVEFHNDLEPRFYLAFTKESTDNSEFHLHLVNDSNYYTVYLISNLDENGYRSALYQGTVEPNTKLSIGTLAFHELNVSWDFQLILFKKGVKYANIAPISTTVHIKPSKILKDNSFKENDFFHQRAVLLSIIKSKLELKVEELTKSNVASIISEKEKSNNPPKNKKRTYSTALLEIDLHIHELIDDTTGLTNGEMLQIQLNEFNFVMERNLKIKGKKIVFIHGVGNGVLKTELRKQLDRKYKNVNYQDASFKEYGFGATMVII